MMDKEVFVKMTEEEVARRWASKENMCLIDWNTLHEMKKYVPDGILIFMTDKCTYKLKSQLRTKLVDKEYA